MASNKNQNNHKTMADDIVEGLSLMLLEVIKLLGTLGFELAKWGGKKLFKIQNRSPIEIRDLKKKKSTKETGTLGYLIKSGRPMCDEDFDHRLHSMIIGPSGYGKTNLMTIMQERAVRLGHSVVFFDPKASAETRNMFTEICARHGRKVYYFNEFTANATPFNPLLDGNVDQICDRIVNACNWSDEFYKTTSVNALKEALTYLKSQREIITLDKIVAELDKRKDIRDISGLVLQLENASMSEFGHLVNSDSPETLSFRKVREENACLYIGISSLGYFETAKFFNRLFLDNLLFHTYQSLQGEVKRSGDMANRPMSVYFDELSSIVTPRFIELQNKCRAAGINITYATQCPSDINTVSVELRDQIFENTENLFLFKQFVPAHTEYLSRMTGTIKEEKVTHSTQDGSRTGMGSSREVERLFLHPNVLRNLRVGQCIFINKKHRELDVLNIREHERNPFLEKTINEQIQLGSAL